MAAEQPRGRRIRATWSLHGDVGKGQFTVRVQYQAGDAPAQHEITHRRLAEATRDFLRGMGLRDDIIQMARVTCEELPTTELQRERPEQVELELQLREEEKDGAS